MPLQPRVKKRRSLLDLVSRQLQAESRFRLNFLFKQISCLFKQVLKKRDMTQNIQFLCDYIGKE